MQAKLESFPDRIKEEWYTTARRYLHQKTVEERWIAFQEIWDVTTPTVHEILSQPETVYNEWCDYNCRFVREFTEDLATRWSEFKTFWDLDSDATKQMFEEMANLSEDLLREWRFKYNFDHPHVYEKEWKGTMTWDTNKPKVQLWKEFKRIWRLNMVAYNEDKFNRIVAGIEDLVPDVDYDEQAWFNYREDANYHSYDSYPVLEQYEIWRDFVDSGCKDPYTDSDSDSSEDSD